MPQKAFSSLPFAFPCLLGVLCAFVVNTPEEIFYHEGTKGTKKAEAEAEPRRGRQYILTGGQERPAY